MGSAHVAQLPLPYLSFASPSPENTPSLNFCILSLAQALIQDVRPGLEADQMVIYVLCHLSHNLHLSVEHSEICCSHKDFLAMMRAVPDY